MKKLFAHQVVFSKTILLVNSKNKIKFVLTRKRHDMDKQGQSHWMLLSGSELLAEDPFRNTLYSFLEKEMGYKIEEMLDSPIKYDKTHS